MTERPLDRRPPARPVGASRKVPYGAWAALLLPPALVMAPVAFLPDAEMARLMTDPVHLHDGRLTDGLVQRLGFPLWCLTAAICLFAAVQLRRLGARAAAAWLACAGLFTALLLFDDMFVLHETLKALTGIPDPVIQGVYGLVGVAYLIAFRGYLLAADTAILGFALACLAASLAADAIPEMGLWMPHRRFIEEAAKLVGIMGWTVFHVRAALRQTLAAAGGARPAG
jgi:hypothetical protein